jgi:hypothetical protein
MMNRFECEDCHKTFLYPAVMTTEMPQTPDTWFEVRICPYCHSMNIKEVEQTIPVEQITSVKSVDLAEVDELLKQGYQVHELYAKTATLVKKEAKKS